MAGDSNLQVSGRLADHVIRHMVHPLAWGRRATFCSLEHSELIVPGIKLPEIRAASHAPKVRVCISHRYAECADRQAPMPDLREADALVDDRANRPGMMPLRPR